VARTVDVQARILDAEGIRWQSVESAPGRGNNERTSVEAFRHGVINLLAIISVVVYD